MTKTNLMALFSHWLNWLSKLLKALWLFIAGVIAVVVIYYLLTGVEQGIDVVIQSGEVFISGVLSMLAVFLWAFLVWYSSRTLSYIKQHKDDLIFSRKSDPVTASILYKRYGIPASFYQHIPRLLAYNCFVSVQAAIFHLPTFFGWTGLAMFTLIVLHNLYYVSLSNWLVTRPRSRKRTVYSLVNPLVIAAYVTFLVYLIVRAAKGIDVASDPLRHKFWLSVIALVMFLLQTLVVFLFVWRRRKIEERRRDSSLKPSRLLMILGFNPEYNAAEAPYFTLLNATAAVAVALYIVAIFVMPFSTAMGPLAFSLLALGVLVGFANLLTLASIRASFNIIVVLFAIAFLFGQYRDPYPVRFRDTEKKSHFHVRPDTRTYLEKWFEKRIPMLRADTARTFPVYIVLSNGGASRAGRWTSTVLGHLQDTSFRLNPRNSFKDHVLCIAGASGGSVGNAAFYSLLKACDEGRIAGDSFRNHADEFFEGDFLTYTLTRLLGPDIFRHLLPVNIDIDNRADALEDVIERGSTDGLLNEAFASSMLDVMDTTGALPILFVNTTQVDNGMPGVVSTVKLPGRSQRQDVLSLVDSMGVNYGKGDISLSTAAVLSSRFPYVSPAGKVFDRYYVDGGYFDNSGAGTVLDFIQELNQFLSDSAHAGILSFRDRFTFHILHITNSEIVQPPASDIHPLTNDLLAPVLTLAGMQGSSTSIGDAVLINAFQQFNTDTANAMIVYSLYDETWDPIKNEGAYEEGYPMSWALSDYQLARMDAALIRANQRNLRKFQFTASNESTVAR
ncbi:MAG TPA: hypothetical protein VFT90_01580 [Chryseosolibacter sp.]|nr:hypothetical protein [Chryseosolibacter sp.]